MLAEIRQQVGGLLGGPRLDDTIAALIERLARAVAVADLECEQDVEVPKRHCAVDWKKSTASMLVACVRRNCRQRRSRSVDNFMIIRFRACFSRVTLSSDLA